MNSADSYIDLEKNDIEGSTQTTISPHFMSECGLLDVFVFGIVDTPALILHHYSLVTGLLLLVPSRFFF
jgi:hypothetical protein